MEEVEFVGTAAEAKFEGKPSAHGRTRLESFSGHSLESIAGGSKAGKTELRENEKRREPSVMGSSPGSAHLPLRGSFDFWTDQSFYSAT